MTTEITSPLPPCPLPDCMGVEHHWHDIAVYAVTETHDCAKTARRGYRCYGPATIPDPDAELIEKIGKAIHDADEVPDEWGDEWGAETYRKLARAALDAVRAHDEAVSGDE